MDPRGESLREMATQVSHEDIDEANLTDVSGSLVHPAIMFRAKALGGLRGYRPQYWPAEDVDFFLRMAEVGRLANLPEVLFRYRLHNKSIGHVHRQKQADASREAVMDAFRRRGITRDLPPIPQFVRYEPESDIHCRWAWWALHYGNVTAARKHAARAVLGAPGHPSGWKVLFCAIRGY